MPLNSTIHLSRQKAWIWLLPAHVYVTIFIVTFSLAYEEVEVQLPIKMVSGEMEKFWLLLLLWMFAHM
jgi:hypothetical protein